MTSGMEQPKSKPAARKPGKNSKRANDDLAFPRVVFISVGLSSDAHDELPDVIEALGGTLALLIEVVQEGLKVSFSYNTRNKSFIATAIGPEDGPDYAKGYGVSGFGSEPKDALDALMYKIHRIMAGTDWEEFATPAGQRSRWG